MNKTGQTLRTCILRGEGYDEISGERSDVGVFTEVHVVFQYTVNSRGKDHDGRSGTRPVSAILKSKHCISFTETRQKDIRNSSLLYF